jgi:hypothetical protein
MKISTLIPAAAMMLAGASLASGIIIAYEGFDFTDTSGGITGSGSGTGWAAGGWQDADNKFQTPTGSLLTNSADFNAESVGNRVIGDLAGGNNNLSRQLAAQRGASDITYIGFAYQMNRTGANEGLYFNLATSQQNPNATGDMRIRVLRDATDTSLSDISFWSGSAWTVIAENQAFNVGDVNRFVLEVNASTDAWKIWINPETQASASFSPSIASGAFDWLNFSGSWNNWALDEVRVGTSFESVAVVPEPSTYAALCGALALVGVMLRRRRKA